MRPVICFGEALIDFLNFNNSQDGLLTLKEFRQYPGGAPANAAVAVAKLGGKAQFAGQVGSDSFGDFLEDALQQYGVDTSLLLRHATANTALAFVMLDESGDRSFNFFRQNTADLLFAQSQIDNSWFAHQAIVHFCSNTLTESAIADCTLALVKRAKQNDALVSFDVNLRHNLWSSGAADIALVNQLVMASDIVKFSKDELAYLAEDNQQQYLQQCLASGVKLAIVTDAQGDIFVHTQQGQFTVTPPTVHAVDTTAGGDAFIGALLFGLSVNQDSIIQNEQALGQLIQFASHCGALAVTRLGAFPALPVFDEVAQQWPANMALPTQTN
ncbi:carbohydrate kinase [uncultured Paraglaciecola sp.]|uniref:carbohydrate kinase family protein n=1 Tax=uncultured Paraglaciecola sp. TaxID=1765024 RepID=UPI002610E7B3|nr:carbohydrate kinase [uncultured Paraglaciecola sp.]